MKKSSTKPKGATSYKDTAFGIIPRSKLLGLEIEGIKRGLEFLSDTVRTDKNVSISPELICKLHDVSFGWIFPQWGGEYRKIQVTFSDKEAPQYFKVPELVKNLCEDLAEQLKHLPSTKKEDFILILLKLDLPPIEFKAGKEADRRQYLTAMQKADEGDYALLEQLIGETLSESLKSSQSLE